jgi:hypothetical protein
LSSLMAKNSSRYLGAPKVKNQGLHSANLTSFHQLSGVCNMYKKYAKQSGPQIQAAQEPATINYCLYSTNKRLANFSVFIRIRLSLTNYNRITGISVKKVYFIRLRCQIICGGLFYFVTSSPNCLPFK